MGKRFLRTIVSDFQTLTASADITPVDLPVNPMSWLALTIEGIGTARTTLANYSLLADFHTGITDVSIRHRGENIVQGQLSDLMMLNALVAGATPWGTKPDGDVGRVRTMTFPLSFSRKPYWHDEAFPATVRGNLRFHMTAGPLPTGFSARRWALEAIELIEDVPTRFLKYTTLTRALTATGRQRINLPLGNDLLGLMLFDPSTEAADAADYAFQKVKLLKDNVEQYYPESNWESLRADIALRLPHVLNFGPHLHFLTTIAAAGEVEEQELNTNQAPLQYGYLDFDPLMDGSYSLETEGAADVQLDINSDVSTGTVRLMPVELVQIPTR
jgi:hypothetical protein